MSSSNRETLAGVLLSCSITLNSLCWIIRRNSFPSSVDIFFLEKSSSPLANLPAGISSLRIGLVLSPSSVPTFAFPFVSLGRTNGSGAAEESSEMSFQALEVESNAYVVSPPVQPRSSSTALMVARVKLGHEYELKRGLGWNDDSMASLVELEKNHGRFGLGYMPTREDVRRSVIERRGKSMGKQQGPQVKWAPLYHINESFISTGWMCEGQIAMIHDEVS